MNLRSKVKGQPIREKNTHKLTHREEAGDGQIMLVRAVRDDIQVCVSVRVKGHQVE